MKRLLATLKRAYTDERGAEGLEKILIIAAVVLPLLAVLIFFRDEIAEYLSDEASDVMDDASSDPTMPDVN